MSKKISGSDDHLEEAKRLVEKYDKYPKSKDPLNVISLVISSIAHSLVDIAESLRVMSSRGKGNSKL
jgi:hypothetical protein